MFKLICSQIRHTEGLAEVSLTMGNVDDTAVDEIVEAVRSNPTVTTLVLDDNQIRDNGIRDVLSLLNGEKMKVISVENQSVHPSTTVLEEVLTAVEGCYSLIKMGVAWRQPAMRHKSEQLLRRNFNKMFEQRKKGQKGQENEMNPGELVDDYNKSTFADSFEMCNDFRLSSLSPHKLKVAIYSHLVRGVLASGFRVIRIVNCRLDNPFAEILTKGLQKDTCVEELILDRNNIHSTGIEAVASLISNNTHLRSIQCKGQKKKVSTETAERIVTAMQKNRTLVKLELDFNLPQHRKAIDKRLRMNSALRRNTTPPSSRIDPDSPPDGTVALASDATGSDKGQSPDPGDQEDKESLGDMTE